MPGRGELLLTGNVARVGKEATQVAHSCLKARAAELGIERAVVERDLHVHYVDTENQKDGPSAGLALALAGLSALSGRPLRAGLVASGEITLQGAVRAVGGLHEKVVAAWLHEQRFVILPRKNLFQAASCSGGHQPAGDRLRRSCARRWRTPLKRWRGRAAALAGPCSCSFPHPCPLPQGRGVPTRSLLTPPHRGEGRGEGIAGTRLQNG